MTNEGNHTVNNSSHRATVKGGLRLDSRDVDRASVAGENAGGRVQMVRVKVIATNLPSLHAASSQDPLDPDSPK